MIKSLLLSLALTLFLENIAAAIFGVKNRKDFLLISLVNIVTNPVLVQTLIIFGFIFINGTPWYFILFLEVVAVGVEGILYRNRLSFNKIKPFLFSLLLNVISYFGGRMLYELFS